MTKCDMGTDCHAICDFCIHMAHNGIDEQGNRRPVDVILADYEGYCEKHQREQYELGSCDDFHCFRASHGKPQKTS